MMDNSFLEDKKINLLLEQFRLYIYADLLKLDGNKLDQEIVFLMHEIIADAHLESKVLNQLEEIKRLCLLDEQMIFLLDPASNSHQEIVLTYPGLYALTTYRIAHVMYEANIPLLPRYLSEIAHSKTGIDIHPGAQIGERTFIDHGTGIVIGETAIVGNDCKIYQGVLLGALSLKEGKKLKNVKRHPTIGNNVTLYSNASILGGDTYIGDNSIIGINCIINKSVEPNSTIIFNQNRYHQVKK